MDITGRPAAARTATIDQGGLVTQIAGGDAASTPAQVQALQAQLAAGNAPRKRGRNPGSKNKPKVTRNASEDATSAQAAPQKRRRGRPPGGGNNVKKARLTQKTSTEDV